ncbi:putative hydrolase of the HAD superfamily [Cohnella sp. OV330]|uniref:HAD-IA family hydrolase n=1 Tax=Cohnella sp. OV330 TaxID=1855288 RepID=UPI0008E4A6E1|nr:HAD-IA family hydrolase [Cohnella sp. OV330]SFB43361.1 putative hydrolase of the HAD superfamily [Cohnella sp. OV330]
MKHKKAMILDVGGVLATNYTPQFWEGLSDDYDVPYDALMQFRKDVRADLWTGAMAEREFWERMSGRFHAIDGADARERLVSEIRPLPALERLAEWRDRASLNILSNHRTEWIAPVLARIYPLADHVIVSAEVGCRKPEPEIYGRMDASLADFADILYVDDTKNNLPQGAALGWKTLLADDEGAWIAQAERWLKAE